MLLDFQLGSTEISGNLEVGGSAEIDGQFQVDGFADFHEDVRILGKLEILNEVEVGSIIGDGSGLSGIVTGLTAGSGISITDTGGIYEIASTGSGSGIGTGILSEIDTLESVTDRGNHTTNTVTVGGLNVFGISSFNDKVYVQGDPLHAGNTASGSVGTINQVLVSTGIGVTGKNIGGLTNPPPNSGATEAGAFRETHKYVVLPQQRYIFVDYMPNYLDIFVMASNWQMENIQQTTAVPFILQRNFLEEILLKYMHIVPYQIGLKVLITKT